MTKQQYKEIVHKKLIRNFDALQVQMQRVKDMLREDNIQDSYNVLLTLNTICQTDFSETLDEMADDLADLYIPMARSEPPM